MFDLDTSPDASHLRAWKGRLADAELAGTDADQIDQIRALEELACAARARQARLTAEFARSQRADQAAVGVRTAHQGSGIAEQIALARWVASNSAVKRACRARAAQATSSSARISSICSAPSAESSASASRDVHARSCVVSR